MRKNIFMKNFEYIAVSSDWSKQDWSIEALNEIEARAKLHKMWFSVLKIFEKWEWSPVKPDDSWESPSWKEKEDVLLLYEFHWFDKEWTPTWWTIESNNEIFAYKRLVEEFWVNPEWVVLSSLSPAIKEVKKKNSIKEITEVAYDEWIDISSPIAVDEEDDWELNASKEQQDQLLSEINEYVPKIESLFEKYLSLISSMKAIETKKKVKALEKIKRSNNIFFVQSEFNEILNEVRDLFYWVEDEKLDEEDVDFLKEVSIYLWYERMSWFMDRFLPFLYRFNFLKPFLDKIKKNIKNSVNKNPEINQQKQKIKRYRSQLVHHLRHIFTSNWNERRKRVKALKKSLKLILSTYKSYNELRKQMVAQKTKFKKRLIKWQKWIYSEFRSFTWWLFWAYVLYVFLIEISIKKWLILPVWPSFQILNSWVLISFLLFILLLNLALKFKIDYFLKMRSFNFIAFPLILIISLLFYNNY